MAERQPDPPRLDQANSNPSAMIPQRVAIALYVMGALFLGLLWMGANGSIDLDRTTTSAIHRTSVSSSCRAHDQSLKPGDQCVD